MASGLHYGDDIEEGTYLVTSGFPENGCVSHWAVPEDRPGDLGRWRD